LHLLEQSSSILLSFVFMTPLPCPFKIIFVHIISTGSPAAVQEITPGAGTALPAGRCAEQWRARTGATPMEW
jgi:hypothetical protein